MSRSVLICLLAGIAYAGVAKAQPNESELVMQVYKIGDLVASSASFPLQPQQWPGTVGLSNRSATQLDDQLNSGGEFGGGMGGGGMGGGMMGMGGGQGGMMSVPDSVSTESVPKYVSPQMGGMGMGGMGGHSFGGGLNSQVLTEWRQQHSIDSDSYQELITTIQSIDGDQWEVMGGSASISTFRDSLIVFASESTHKKIAELLKALRKDYQSEPHLKLEWVVANVSDIDNLPEDALAKATIASGVATCRNLHTVSASHGTHKAFVIGANPLVGGDGPVGYQPSIKKLVAGWTLEMRPTLSHSTAPVPLIANIDVACSYSRAPESAEFMEHTPDVMVDRVSLDAVELNGSVACAAGKWREVAAFERAVQAESKDDSVSTLRLFVRWTVAAAVQ